MPSGESQKPPRWIQASLFCAGIYNLFWGTVVICLPHLFFAWSSLPPPRYPEIWQCVGMIVGVYGLGYVIAARSPFVHWPIVAVGLLGKILGPLGFVVAAIRGTLPWSQGLMILANDLLWWFPFATCLYLAFRWHSDPRSGGASRTHASPEAFAATRSSAGQTLRELSSDQPLLLVFLRHSGCVFCREALADLAEQRAEIEGSGFRIGVVTMSSPQAAEEILTDYGLSDVACFSDPQCLLYEYVELGRGSLAQLFGWETWRRAIPAIFLRRHGLGKLDGDGFQMPGTVLIRDGMIVESQHALTASDRPNYAAMVCNRPPATANIAG